MKFIAYTMFLYILFLAIAPGAKAMYAGLSQQEQQADCCNKCGYSPGDSLSTRASV